MQTARKQSPEVNPDVILSSYDDAAARADSLVACLKTAAQLKLETARQEFERAEGQLRIMDAERERDYIGAIKTYEQEYRQASNANGLAFTQAINELDARKAEIEKRCEDSTEAERRALDEVSTNNKDGTKKSASVRPWYDAVNSSLFESCGVRDRELAESQLIYQADKSRIDGQHAARLEEIMAKRQQACAAAQQKFDLESTALMQPAKHAMALAQAFYNKEMAEIEAYENSMRLERLAIWRSYQDGRMSAQWAINGLDNLYRG
ncbi:MAG: hypothetical protein JSS83_28940 [Cyanobacteria bacterium SZAS LIN-3]|nr:hypothetical protein [Cyanobacteria bacterium SZAS LIN-3]